ncbi:nicotinamide mononucleotide transporter [Filimonas lacunae]|uniref:Nicotinamide riboside transporter PnuC n=1 Tax=Filimonas lacunae TaxID=477680 RepID=A0A173MPX7_9BACT|nr:nicotinamide riboside transporter PnuC [Filimonas lacunae]BAV09546.1 ribosyl nicotinamide transporter, PnuC-like [Filimonas lacunae]SIS74999.1 nicotinamide mononucleotide transporter [Filimonas lacunae]
MNLQHWISLFAEQVQNTSFPEWIAVAFGVTEVLLARKNNILLYPAGIISTIITTWLMFSVKLYAESLLNAYYLIMSIYGWVYWIKKRNTSPIPVSYTSKKEWEITALIIGVGWLFLFSALKYFTPSTTPVWDAWVSCTAWAGMWLLAKRKVENWILLNVSNLFAVPLLFHKELPLMACLTIFLFVVAISGYFDWKKIAGPRQGNNNDGGTFSKKTASA